MSDCYAFIKLGRLTTRTKSLCSSLGQLGMVGLWGRTDAFYMMLFRGRGRGKGRQRESRQIGWKFQLRTMRICLVPNPMTVSK